MIPNQENVEAKVIILAFMHYSVPPNTEAIC